MNMSVHGRPDGFASTTIGLRPQQTPTAAPQRGGGMAGHFATRLSVDPHDGLSSVAVLAVRNSGGLRGKIESGMQKLAIKFSGKYIKADVLDQTDGTAPPQVRSVAINVNSLSKRLGLGKEEIKTLAREGKLSDVMQSVQTTSGADQSYHEALGADGGKRVLAPQITKLFAENALHGHATLEVGKTRVTLAGDRVKTTKRLGAGTFGTAYKVNEFSVKSSGLSSISTFAEKWSNVNAANPRFASAAREDLVAEHGNLRMIDQLARSEGRQDALEGLQETPSSISFHGERGVMRGKLYEGSLAGGYSNMSVADRLRGAAPLLKGLAYIQEKGLVHVDIKPDNIFVDRRGNGQPIFRLADFGGARFARQIPPGQGLPHTPHFTPHPQLEPMNSSNPRSLHAIGTFQMGVSLFQILSGEQYPYPQSGNPPYQLTNYPFNEAALAGYPKEVVDFVKSMVDPDPSKRPVGGEITAKFNQLTAKFGSLENMARYAEQGRQNYDKAVKAFSQLKDTAWNRGPLPTPQAEQTLKMHFQRTGQPAFLMRFSQSQNQYVISGIRRDGQIQHFRLSDFAQKGNDAFEAARACGFA